MTGASAAGSAGKVLLVDDEPNILSGYRRSLRAFDVITAESAFEALRILASDPAIAVVASDFHMPVMDGLKFINQARLDFPDITYLMITGADDQATAVSAINDLGIFRFINKPCKADVLQQSIGEALAHFQTKQQERSLVEESRQQVDRLHDQVDKQKQRDGLTGLGNRLKFVSALGERIERNELEQCAVACLDIDFFRLFNDGQGADAGDALLQNTAALLTRLLDADDIVARISADTFVMLLAKRDPGSHEKLGRELQHTFCQQGFDWQDRHFDLHCSLGLVHLSGVEPNPETVLRLAEVAKIKARELAAGYFAGTTADLDLRSYLEESRVVETVRQALSENRFELYQQKIEPVDPGEKGIHIEVLIRLKDREGEDISPSVFIPLAERYRLSTRMDQCVIEGVARWIGENPAVLEFVSLCSINLSTTTLRNLALVDEIRSMFERAWIEPSRICFEITETSAMDDVDTSIRFIEALRGHGFKVAIDDFGTGYSSFAYLRTLPVDFLKIDGTFISSLDSNEVDRVITSSINDIAHVLGKKTIAEYVENEAIAALLKEMGVDYLQGYHIAKPQPLALLTSPLKNARLGAAGHD